MAFTGASENERAVHTEALLMANASTANGSTIDFVKPGQNFVAVLNTGAVNTVGAITTDLEGSYDGTNWVDIDGAFAADFDTATIVAAYDAQLTGDWPYYRLTFDAAADDSSTTITYKIITSTRQVEEQ
ncbi:MAG: hypothetical protein R3268_00105 [Acidiferrobacterales bacterium]|nr:hypothetical protein [Acidiferrobacterales bacterium]